MIKYRKNDNWGVISFNTDKNIDLESKILSELNLQVSSTMDIDIVDININLSAANIYHVSVFYALV